MGVHASAAEKAGACTPLVTRFVEWEGLLLGFRALSSARRTCRVVMGGLVAASSAVRRGVVAEKRYVYLTLLELHLRLWTHCLEFVWDFLQQ